MDPLPLSAGAEQSVTTALVWVGFGTLAGLLAKAVMPGRDPGGAVTTILMGIGGSVIGSALVAYFWDGRHIKPISVPGFLVATAGAFLLLGFYRLFSGRLIREPGTPRTFAGDGIHRRRRIRESAYDD